MDLSDTYRRLLRIPEDRIVILPSAEPIGMSVMQTRIIFILAKWSGASQIAFRTLNAVLSDMDDLQDLKLCIADTDDEGAEQFMIQSGDIPSGGGETYWVKDGRLVAKMANYDDKQKPTLREYTERVVISDRNK